MAGKGSADETTILDERNEDYTQKTCIGKLLEKTSDRLHGFELIVAAPVLENSSNYEYREELLETVVEYHSEISEAMTYLQDMPGF